MYDTHTQVCRNFLDGHIVVLLQNILNHRGASEGRALAVIDSITEVRQILGSRLIKEGDITKLRDMLYLDLGLEAQVSHCNTLQHTATHCKDRKSVV